MNLELCTWLAIALVITLRSLAVYSHHFVADDRPQNLLAQVLGWFRFYKPGFSTLLGLVAFFLAGVAYLDGAFAWTLGNLVFGLAAFVNFQKHRDFAPFARLRSVLQSNNGAWLFFGLIPVAILFGQLLELALTHQPLSGTPFSYTGAYLLAVVFLAMKLQVWGSLSHDSWPYLIGVLVWDLLLLIGAVLSANLPFLVLEGYALLLDVYTLWLVKSASLAGLLAGQAGRTKQVA